MLYFAKPALASLPAITVLNERPGINLLAGIVIIAAGILISLYIGQREKDTV